MNKTQKKTKGQLGSLQGAIVIIASVGLLIVIMLYLMSNLNNSLDTDGVAVSVVNESGFINTTGYTLSGYSAKNFAGLVVSAVINATSNGTIGSGNYTVSDAGVVTNATATNWETVKITYAYTYSQETASSNATNTLSNQFVDFLPWLGIILLVLAAGIVLFFVIRSFNTPKGV